MTASVGDNVTIMYTRKKVGVEDTIIYKEGMCASRHATQIGFEPERFQVKSDLKSDFMTREKD